MMQEKWDNITRKFDDVVCIVKLHALEEVHPLQGQQQTAAGQGVRAAVALPVQDETDGGARLQCDGKGKIKEVKNHGMTAHSCAETNVSKKRVSADVPKTRF